MTRGIHSLHGLSSLRAAKDLEGAEQVGKRLLKDMPKKSSSRWPIHQELARVYIDGFNFALAVKHITKSLDTGRMSFVANFNAASLFKSVGHQHKSVLALKKALTIKPSDVDASRNLVSHYIELGQLVEARLVLDELLKRHPGTGMLWLQLVNLCDIDELPGVLKKLQAARVDFVGYEFDFALARAYERCGSYEAAFDLYKEGNKCKRASQAYSSARLESFVSSIIAQFSADKLLGVVRENSSSDRPIFIVGMPRSGSTLVEQVLSSHSLVEGFGELNLLTKLVPNLSAVDISDSEEARKVGSAYLDSIARMKPLAKRFTDKKLYNFFYVGLIRLILPDARIIQVERDSRDVTVSCFRTLFAEGNEWSYDLQEIHHFYTQYWRLMSHWHSVFPGQVYKLVYEELIEDFERETRKLLAFCDLGWESSCMQYYKSKRPINTASMIQVREKPNRDGIGRWKMYSEWLPKLIAAPID